MKTFILIFFPFFVAILIPFLGKSNKNATFWYAITVPLISLLNLFYIHQDWLIAGHKILKYEIPWVPEADINISFMVDHYRNDNEAFNTSLTANIRKEF